MSNQAHPKGLYTLFFTEMWERFGYYGMRALLTLYLTAELIRGGFGLDRAEALAIYGIFTGLVYLTPILGGYFADKILGQRKAIFIGAFVMAAGQFLLAASSFMANSGDLEMRQFLFNLGIGVLILGNGFFKPNISTIVGELYEPDDPRKDSAFTIFYMGINIGAFLAPFIAGTLGERVAWHWGFMASGFGMILSIIWFYLRRHTLLSEGLPPDAEKGQTDLIIKDWRDILYYSVICILSVFVVLKLWAWMPPLAQTIVMITLGVVGGLTLLYIITKGTEGPDQWTRVLVIIVLAIFNVVFWAGFEQAGGTFNLFAEESTNRSVFGFNIPTTWFQNINPILIVVLAPIYSIMWSQLTKLKLNPRTPVKFSLGLVLGSLAFFVMAIAASKANDGNMVSPLWLVSVYALLTMGELMLSPIGLSMITKLAPAKIVSVMMGVWMASFALGNYLAATLENILVKFDLPLYTFLAWFTLGSALFLLLLSPLLNRAMKGIH
jgi:POT family proton-dependent oligopeptide transporter